MAAADFSGQLSPQAESPQPMRKKAVAPMNDAADSAGLDEQWVESQPGSRYTLVLVPVTPESGRSSMPELFPVMTINIPQDLQPQNPLISAIVTGSFATRAEANALIREKNLAPYQPIVVSFETLRALRR